MQRVAARRFANVADKLTDVYDAWLHFVCLADVDDDAIQERSEELNAQLGIARASVADAIGYRDCATFGILSTRSYLSAYSGRDELREYSDSIFEQYQRYVLCQDESDLDDRSECRAPANGVR
jgi:hypothetical protein